MPSHLRALRVVVAAAFHADPRRAIAVIVLTVPAAAANAGIGYALKLFTDAAIHRNTHALSWALAMFAVIAVVSALSGAKRISVYMTLQEKTGLLIFQDALRITSSLPGLEHHENPRYRDELALLYDQAGSLAGIVEMLVNNLAAMTNLVATSLVLATVHPALLLLLPLGLPSMWASVRAAGINHRAEERTASDGRLATHLFGLATTVTPAMEFRIFGLADPLRDRHRALSVNRDTVMRRAAWQGGGISFAGGVVFSLGYIVAIVFAVLRVVDGRASIGVVLMTMTVAAQAGGVLASVVRMARILRDQLKVASRYVWLTDHAATIARLPGTSPAPDALRDGIELRNVSFRYPETDVDVLTNVSLRIPAGTTVAIVGENGAGKTTLIKLLLRFYEPTSGDVQIDGQPFADIDVAAWRERTSAAFQDFVRFEYTAREAIGLGDVAHLDDDEVIRQALLRAAAGDVAAQLADGLGTQLGRAWGGVELSGGQWQKLAVARGMMRPQPLLLALDEPTSALDAQTEHALFEQYAGAARRTRATNGGITILVSHRFSTVRMADRIIVLDGHSVADVGTHSELMQRGGLYRELYSIQAKAYA